MMISILIFFLKSLQIIRSSKSLKNTEFLELSQNFFNNPRCFYKPENNFEILDKEAISLEEFDKFQESLPDEIIEEEFLEEKELIYSLED